MQQFDPQFIDATNWQVLPWFNSGGTRTKRVLQDEQGKLWYFKCSERKAASEGRPEKYYKFEFWSEIIAYQLGRSLGLDILRYDAAIHNGEIGCISPLMINQDKEQLIEVGRYMTSINERFNPDDRKTHKEYSFDFLVETLEAYDLSAYTALFLKTMIFDALIGNTDRHQENWAFIGSSTFYDQVLQQARQQAKDPEPSISLLKRLADFFKKRNSALDRFSKDIRLAVSKVLKMAPIYDSGSSLGRELSEARIETLLKEPDLLEQYIQNGKSELHWEKRKISHLEMIANLISSAYLEQVLEVASFLDKFDEQNAVQLVSMVDKEVPEAFQHYCLPGSRKDFIIKLLTLRSQKLKEIIRDGRV